MDSSVTEGSSSAFRGFGVRVSTIATVHRKSRDLHRIIYHEADDAASVSSGLTQNQAYNRCAD